MNLIPWHTPSPVRVTEDTALGRAQDLYDATERLNLEVADLSHRVTTLSAVLTAHQHAIAELVQMLTDEADDQEDQS
jgi:phosphoserine aminotransferase